MMRVLLISMMVVSCGVSTKYRENKIEAAQAPRDFPENCSMPTIEESLKCIPGITFEKKDLPTPAPQGYQLFEIQFTQPADHNNPTGEKFQQKLMLWHKDVGAPMVLQTSGYSIFSVKRAEITAMFDANQIQIEHRYFLTSRPASGDWSLLTVEQSAKDFHRISEAFHSIYKGKWVGTGASKGGMTSIYHRYFYPNDVDATVAYVAPSSHSLNDNRYNQFLETVGGDQYADCRSKINDFQRTLLKRKAEVLPLVEGKFSMIGGKELAYEYAASEAFFTFWQYISPTSPTDGCSSIPEADATPEKLADGLQSMNPVDGYGDKSLIEFNPYFYQAASELGAAAPRLANIADLISYPADAFTLSRVVPSGSNPQYNGALVMRIEDWAKEESNKIIFIYGSFDSWTAAAFPKPTSATESHYFTQFGGNHRTKIETLNDNERTRATLILDKWLGSPLEPLNTRLGEKKNFLGNRFLSEKGVIRSLEETTEDAQFKRRR